MKPQTLKEITKQLTQASSGQFKSLQERLGLIPQQVQAGTQQLEAQQRQAFNDITQGANRRGLVFSGIPIEEQAEFTSTEFLPALAGLRADAEERRFSINDAIEQLRADIANRAFNTREDQITRFQNFQADQADRALRARSSGGSGGSSGSSLTPKNSGFKSGRKKVDDGAGGQKTIDELFFVDSTGRPVSAFDFAEGTGQSLVGILQSSPSSFDRETVAIINQLANQGLSESQIETWLRRNRPQHF